MDTHILAIDIGFRATGIAIMEIEKDTLRLELTDCFRPKPNKSSKTSKAVNNVEMIMFTAKALRDLIIKHKIKNIVVELPHGGSKSSAAIRGMALASGMIGTVVALMELNVEWYTPMAIKMAATGKKKAEKDEMMLAMETKYPGIKDIPKCRKEHIADAIACGLASEKGKIVNGIRSKIWT